MVCKFKVWVYICTTIKKKDIMKTKIKVNKIRAGVYMVTKGNNTYMVRGGKNYNIDSLFFKSGRFEIWTANSEDNCNDGNCWAVGAFSKSHALEIINNEN